MSSKYSNLTKLHHFVHLGNFRIFGNLTSNPLSILYPSFCPKCIDSARTFTSLLSPPPPLLRFLLSTFPFVPINHFLFSQGTCARDRAGQEARQWSWLFSNGPARYVEAIVRAVLVWQWSSVSAGLIKARSAATDQTRLWFIPAGYGTAWINDPSSTTRILP